MSGESDFLGVDFLARLQIRHFSECVLNDREPEPSGEEGLQDVRIVQAIYESAEIGKPVAIPPYEEEHRPSGGQVIQLPPVEKPELVKVEAAHE